MDYFIGSDILVGDLGARDMYEELDLLGADPTPAQLAELQRGLASVDKAAADALVKKPAVPFLQKQVGDSNLRVWQAGVLGVGGLALVAGVVGMLRRK
jgi:hypothetical protein